MRSIPMFAAAALLLIVTACSGPPLPIAIGDARSQLSSPKPRYYLFQTIGPGHELPGEADTVWIPVAGAEADRRIVIRYGDDERLEHAAVVSAGPQGKFDVTEEVLFDRTQWRQTAQTSRSARGTP